MSVHVKRIQKPKIKGKLGKSAAAFKESVQRPNRPVKPELRRPPPRKPIWCLGQAVTTGTTENDKTQDCTANAVVTPAFEKSHIKEATATIRFCEQIKPN